MDHELKIWPVFLAKITSGAKKFELRKNDRDYSVGDGLHLIEYDPKTEKYGCHHCYATVTDMMKLRLPDAPWVIMSIEINAFGNTYEPPKKKTMSILQWLFGPNLRGVNRNVR